MNVSGSLMVMILLRVSLSYGHNFRNETLRNYNTAREQREGEYQSIN